eukprot:TRINITY_DN20605_c0_g1_i2.p1 TRINITY_DN20605_c0_g1~~TRINITY_DN20605_c0_g1_i2.p1  ORF type:complete len:1548 (-),score=461.11 TRINITY_DN20605_c0_g1_i2:90-4733(-)
MSSVDGTVARSLAASTANAAGGQGVRVVCRLRPMNDWEKKAGTVPAAQASGERKEVAVVRMLGGGTRQVRSTFHFDDVLTSFSTQNEVFASTLEPLIGEVLSGFEATAFAYGQTGTGKTYTMEGNLDVDEGRGMVPRAADAVFRALAGSDYLDHTVKVSYLEIYNEELCDLLAPPHMHQKLDLKDIGSGRGVCCMGLSEVKVNCVDDILKLVSMAQVRCRRAVVGCSGELENVGKLHLVDLAGSENAKKASQSSSDDGGVGGVPAPVQQGSKGPASRDAVEEERERRNINQSLLTLGRVINALREGSGRVPYRDSKLTRLLQDALGGRCMTVIIATISPALSAVEETISTLTYAEQACGIKNRPVASSLFRTVRQAGASEGTAGAGGGDYAELELKAAYLAQEVEEAQAALARQYREAQEQAAIAAAAEARLGEAEQELGRVRREVEEQSYMRQCLAAYAETSNRDAGRLALALDASTSHGEELARRLTSRCSELAAIKQQAQKICADAEDNSTVLSEATKNRVKEVAAAVGETHSAHRQATRVAGEITQEQQRILGDLLQSLEMEVCKAHLGAKKAEESSVQVLGSLVEEAKGVLEASGAAVAGALGSAASALGEVCIDSGKMDEALQSAASSSREALSERCQSLAEKLRETRESLGAAAGSTVAALKEAEEASQKQGKALEEQVESTVSAPLLQLQSSLKDTLGQATDLSLHLTDTLRREAEEEGPASSGRWESFLGKLTEYTAEHQKLAAEGGPQPAVRQALEALRAKLLEGVDATAAALTEAAKELGIGQEALRNGTTAGQKAVSGLLAEADGALVEAWDQQLTTLSKLDRQLLEAKQDQEASNAAQKLQQSTATAAQDLLKNLTGAVASLASAREEIAGQVTELEAKRASEQAAVSLLAQQREALQADVDGLQKKLEALGSELQQGQSQLAELRAAQRTGRERALEAIVAAAKAELSALGEGIEAGSEAINGRFASGMMLAKEVADSASEAAKRSDVTGAEVSDVVTTWSTAVGRSCEAISKAQQNSAQAADTVTAAGQATEAELSAAGEMAATWGKDCERVAALLGSAQGSAGELRRSDGQQRAAWQEHRATGFEAAERWASSNGEVSATLEEVMKQVRGAERALSGEGGLQSGVQQQHGEAAEQAARWSIKGEEHHAALVSLAALGQQLQTEEAAAAERRQGQEGLAGLDAAAATLQAAAEENLSSAGSVGSALEALSSGEAAPLRSGRRAAEAALAAGESATARLQEEAERSLRAAAEELGAGLGPAQAAALKELTDDASQRIQSLRSSAEAAQKAATQAQEASNAGTQVALDQWQGVEEIRGAAVASIGASCEKAKSAALAATKVASDQILAELEKGGSARERAAAAAAGVAAGTASALAQHQAALRQGFCGEPLAAFAEASEEEQLRGSRGPLPLPEAMERPNVDLRPRPTDEELLNEFRKGGTSPKSIGTEPMLAPAPSEKNVLPCPSPDRQDSEIWIDEVDQENAGGASAATAPTAAKPRKPSPAKREGLKGQAGKRSGSRTPRNVLGEANRSVF